MLTADQRVALLRTKLRLTAQLNHQLSVGEAKRWAFAAWVAQRRGASPHRVGQERMAMAKLKGETYFPVQGKHNYINSHWDSNQDGYPDFACDIFAAEGTPIVAMVDGEVTIKDWPSGGHTAYVVGDNGRDFYNAHMVQGSGRAGRVTAGTVIGKVGRTGNARTTPAHNHFAMGTRGNAADSYGQGNIAPWPILNDLDGIAQGEDPVVIDELEAQNAQLNEQLLACQTYTTATQVDVIAPTVDELDRERSNPSFDQNWLQVWADRLRPHA